MASFDDLTDVLDEIGVRWAIAGAVAANRYRKIERQTGDIDLLVEWSESLPGALQSGGWDLVVAADPGEPPHLIRARSDAKVDLMIAMTDYQSVALGRATNNWLSIEDVIVHKLIAGRPRDVDDIESILSTRRVWDAAYVEKWAIAWEVIDSWRTIQASSTT